MPGLTVLTYMADGVSGRPMPSLIEASLCRGLGGRCPIRNIAADAAAAATAKSCAGCTVGTSKVHAPKVYALNRSLSDLIALKGPDELVMFIDGADVAYGGCARSAKDAAAAVEVASLQSLLERKLARVGASVIFGAEIQSWDHGNKPFPKRNTTGCALKAHSAIRFQHLNSGMMAGRAASVARVVHWVVRNWNEPSTKSRYNSDQGKFGRYFLTQQHDVRVALDYCGDLFFNAMGVPRPLSPITVNATDRKIYYLPNERPLCFVHWNGPIAKWQSAYKQVTSLYGLASQNTLKCDSDSKGVADMSTCSYRQKTRLRRS